MVADQFGCEFVNATEKISAGSVDHLHLSPEGHAEMAGLIGDKILQIFGQK